MARTAKKSSANAVSTHAAQHQPALEALQRRVEVLEAREAITRFMYLWARTADAFQRAATKSEARRIGTYLTRELMTKNGISDFSQIPGWAGVWGPDKASIINKIVAFGSAIGWSSHMYLNETVDVNLETGTALFSTTAEYVPLTMNGDAFYLILSQRSFLSKVNGNWRMANYELSNLRQIYATAPSWNKPAPLALPPAQQAQVGAEIIASDKKTTSAAGAKQGLWYRSLTGPAPQPL